MARNTLVLADLVRGLLKAARRARRQRSEPVRLALEQGGGVEAGGLESMPVGDGVGGTGLDTVPAEDAARVIDVVDLGVAFAAGNSGGLGVLRRFDIDAVGRTGRRAQKTGDTLLQPV